MRELFPLPLETEVLNVCAHKSRPTKNNNNKKDISKIRFTPSLDKNIHACVIKAVPSARVSSHQTQQITLSLQYIEITHCFVCSQRVGSTVQIQPSYRHSHMRMRGGKKKKENLFYIVILCEQKTKIPVDNMLTKDNEHTAKIYSPTSETGGIRYDHYWKILPNHIYLMLTQ